MFNSLEGIVSGKERDCLFLRTGGVEWELAMSVRDIENTADIGGTARIWTHLVHRETEMKLFGFASSEQRHAFLQLQKVEGIGPKAALKILSGISLSDLERALEAGDLARLETVPGLGKKTAQKMILALKGKIASGGGEQKEISPYNELANALCEMGYDKKSAIEALNKAALELNSSGDKDNENAIFRKAILLLTT
ncbi:MAG: Holliday junction branch migration protein RuvA [Termitinemataceae bacterium]|nr:MAG: Holliday junction branch migration protein RuvA [Termitinemataceae bacterium]